MTRRTAVFGFALWALLAESASGGHVQAQQWRAATEAELKTIIPARAQVEKERIETEFRTASGITNGKGRYVAGVVLITAGYSAEGKYSHFFVTQEPIHLDSLALPPGNYVFGWKRASDDVLDVRFYEAETGKFVGSVQAVRNSRLGRIQSFLIQPSSEKPLILIGRFGILYKLGG
jgi:hypothetical protein